MTLKSPSRSKAALAASLLLFLALFAFQTTDQDTAGKQDGPHTQLERDTAEARRWIEVAEAFQDSAQYDSALVYFERAADLYRPHLEGSRDTALWKVYLECGNQIGDCYMKLADYEKSLSRLTATLEQGKEYLGERHPAVAVSYYNIGYVYRDQGSYEAALENHQKALKIRINTFGENHPKVADSYHGIGYICWNQGAYEAALEHTRKALKIRINTFGENHPKVAASYNNIGLVYMAQGFYEAALECHQKALKIRINTFGENHPEVAMSYGNIGAVYGNEGAYEAALENNQKALKIQIRTLGENHPNVAWSYRNIGLVYADQGNYEAALEYYEKALKIHIRTLGENHPSVAWDYRNIGSLYKKKGAYGTALEYHEKALKIQIRTLGENHPSVAFIYNDIGIDYTLQEIYELALENFQKALTIRINILGENHPFVAASYGNIGIIYTHQGANERALENFQKALIANSIDFKEQNVETNPTLNNEFLSEIGLLGTIQNKANTLFTLYKHKANDPAYLPLSRLTYQLAIGLIDKMRQSYKRQKDKAELLKTAFAIYEGAIQTALTLHRQTQQDSFLHQAFTAFEKSRSILLLEEMQNTRAKSFAGIPDALLEQEENVSVRLVFYEKSLFEEKLKKEAADSAKLALWQDKVFQLRQVNDSIVQVLETQYPNYYRLKYDISVVSLADAQNLLPDERSALLEYFVGDSSIYAFLIGPEAYQCLEIKRDFPLEEWVQGLRESIYGYHLSAEPSESLYRRCADSIAILSLRLYQKLLAPVAQAYGLPERLIISPDGVLGYLPFELLLKEMPEQAGAFASHPYLVRDHQVSYAYSATLLQEMQEKKAGRAAGSFAAFAPSFSGETLASRSIADIRSELGALRHNIPEAEALQALMGGKAYTAEAATKDQFLREAPNYCILHLATHGKANDHIGDYAYLAFAEIPDSIENERLYNRDLYNLRLNADMVVLSACETGIGELRRGEGIVSLARGFSYAGAKSLVTSLWSVDDGRAKEIMEGFYAHIKVGLPKDEALRRAKLDYLAANSSLNAHPFYWAGFIVMGDMAPVELGGGFPWLWVGLGAVLMVIGYFLLRRKLF